MEILTANWDKFEKKEQSTPEPMSTIPEMIITSTEDEDMENWCDSGNTSKFNENAFILKNQS